MEINEISFPLDSGEMIYGTIYGSGDPALILVHQFTYSASQKDWKRFARLAVEEGFTVLTLDVPGFGKTPGDPAVPLWDESVLAAVDYLEGRGQTRIACLGACTGGTTCLTTADEYEYIALGLVSTEMPGPDYDYDILTMPKLFISTEGEYGGDFAAGHQEMYDKSPKPKEIHVLPGDAHGTDILNSYYGTELIDRLLVFLNTIK
jgi:esterase/lipase